MLGPGPDDLEEPNSGSRWGDPEHDLPPQAPSIDEADVDDEIRMTFWRSVLLANVALFALTVGPMLAYFRGRWTVGAVAVALGVVMVLRIYQHYRAFERRHDDERNA
ncbi:DUF7322 domain-containing protein [Haloplanus sp. C73]|uniref:DUF7322 domain-containing protein n=1 Tax=Haloplanus sp. C73 TaxID=3421641 RepID=UPI003EBEED74